MRLLCVTMNMSVLIDPRVITSKAVFSRGGRFLIVLKNSETHSVFTEFLTESLSFFSTLIFYHAKETFSSRTYALSRA